MKKYEIVKKNTDFNDIIKMGKCLKGKYFYVYYVDNYLTFSKFGLAVSKKCGNAVLRNKIKRQLRMIIDNNKKLFSIGKNYIIIVRKGIVDITFQEMEDSLKKLIKKEENK